MTDTASETSIAELAAAVAYNIASTHKRTWPYAHLMPTQVFPPAMFDQLRSLRSASHLLAPVSDHAKANAFQGETEAEQYRYFIGTGTRERQQGIETHPSLDLACDVLSHPLVIGKLIERFRPELHAIYRTDALPLAAGLGYFENDPGYELLPRTDTPQKVLTLLIYMADDDAHPELGTDLFMLRPGVETGDQDVMRQRFRRSSFLHVATAPYRPNHGLAFVPGQNSFHGMGKVTGVEGRLRRALEFQLLLTGDQVKRVT